MNWNELSSQLSKCSWGRIYFLINQWILCFVNWVSINGIWRRYKKQLLTRCEVLVTVLGFYRMRRLAASTTSWSCLRVMVLPLVVLWIFHHYWPLFPVLRFLLPISHSKVHQVIDYVIHSPIFWNSSMLFSILQLLFHHILGTSPIIHTLIISYPALLPRITLSLDILDQLNIVVFFWLVLILHIFFSGVFNIFLSNTIDLK